MLTRTRLLVAAVIALAVLAVAALGWRALQPHPLARELATVAPPPPAATPSAPAAPTPTARPPLDEKQFIEISSTILIMVAQIQDKPNAKDMIPGLEAKVLQEAGVTEEDWEACAQRVYADPAHSRQVADAILKRVDERTTPQMSVKVRDLAASMRQAQAAQGGPKPTPQKP